jgi:hypothetical protein
MKVNGCPFITSGFSYKSFLSVIEDPDYFHGLLKRSVHFHLLLSNPKKFFLFLQKFESWKEVGKNANFFYLNCLKLKK